MDLNRWVEEIKQKGTILVEMGKLRVRKVNLERRISKIHCRIGERVDYLSRLGRDLNDDEVLKGLIQEIRNVEKEIEELDEKLSALRREQEASQEEGCGAASDKDVS